MKVCGIDPSLTSTGIVVLKGDKVISETQISFPEKKSYGHFGEMYSFFNKVWRDWEIKAFSIENYAFAAKGNTLTRLVELGSMIRYVAALHKQPTYIIAPQNLKKFVAGKTFKKDEMRLEVYKKWGFEHKSTDIVDAYALARYTQAIFSHICGEPQKLTEYQKQAIGAWTKNRIGVNVEKPERANR
jgi:crossover junction endodeoxyribonuclease RuvC